MRRNNYIEENNIQSESSPYLNMKEKLQNSYMDGEYEASISNDINESILSAKDIIINQMKKAEAESLCRLNRPKVRLFPQILYLGLYISFLIIGFALVDNISQAMQIPLHRITDSASNGSVFPVVTEHFSASSDHAFL